MNSRTARRIPSHTTVSMIPTQFDQTQTQSSVPFLRRLHRHLPPSILVSRRCERSGPSFWLLSSSAVRTPGSRGVVPFRARAHNPLPGGHPPPVLHGTFVARRAVSAAPSSSSPARGTHPLAPDLHQRDTTRHSHACPAARNDTRHSARKRTDVVQAARGQQTRDGVVTA